MQWTDPRVAVANIGGPVIHQLEIETSNRRGEGLLINKPNDITLYLLKFLTLENSDLLQVYVGNLPGSPMYWMLSVFQDLPANGGALTVTGIEPLVKDL